MSDPFYSDAGDETVRDEAFLRDVMDPFVRSIVAAVDPWDAYNEVAGMRGSMPDYVEWGVHGGQVFDAWTGLADLYVTGTTPIEDAHGALRQAAGDWLARPALPDMTAYVEGWTARTRFAVSAITERDGDVLI